MLKEKVSLVNKVKCILTIKPLIIMVFFGFLTFYASYSFSAWEDYKEAEFEDILKKADSKADWDITLYESTKKLSKPEDFKPGLETLCLSSNRQVYKVKLIYTGQIRKINETKKNVLVFWLKSRGQDLNIGNLINHEMLFIDNYVEYWLPVQDVLIPHFQKEISEKEVVKLYVGFYGFIKKGKEREYVFTINEFEKL